MYGKPSTMLWPGLAAIVLAASWIIPNHNNPWRVFHQDAWMALCILCLGVWVTFQCGKLHAWSAPSIITACCALIPILQWYFGLIATTGQAILASSYVLCLAFAMLLSQQIQKTHAKLLLNCLFTAIFLGCVTNVTIQLFQWLAIYDENLLSFIGFWILPVPSVSRPSGNLLQPNQLATLLVWGMLAGYWGYVQRTLNLTVLSIYWFFLGLGIAITQSRIGMIELYCVCVLVYFWRRLLPDKRLLYCSIGLALFVTILYFLIPSLSGLMGLEYSGRNHSELTQDNIRSTAYRIFYDALFAHPWFGYGMGHLGNAYLELIKTQALQPVYFLHSHNVFLDILLWFGLPLGLLLIVGIFYWLVKVFRSIDDFEKAIVFVMIMALGLHSLVELPHQFMYFVVPIGFAAGSLNQIWPTLKISRWATGFFTSIALVLWAIIFSDYLKTEEHYSELLFEQQRIGLPLGNPVPELIVLNQLQYMMQLHRARPAPGMSDDQLNWMRKAALGEVSTGYFNLIASLALNGHKDEAIEWMYKLNAISSKSGYQTTLTQWQALQKKYPELANLSWVPLRTK